MWEVKDIVFPKIKPLVEKIIYPEETHFLFGRGGAWKSTTLLYLAICMCSNIATIFGNTIASRVLWIDEEMGRKGLFKKIDLIAKGLNLPNEEWKKNFHYWTMSGVNVEDKNTRDEIEIYVENNNIKCIIVDSLTAVTSGEDSTNARLVREFEKIAYKTGCAICITHHIAKCNANKATLEMEDLRGTVDFAYQCDNVYSFTTPGHIRIRQNRGRHLSKSDYIDYNIDIKDLGNKFSFEMVGKTSDVTAQTKQSNGKKFVVRIFKDKDSLEKAYVLEALKKVVGKSTVYIVIDELKDDNIIREDNKMLSKGGNYDSFSN